MNELCEFVGLVPWWTALLWGVFIGIPAYFAGRLMSQRRIFKLEDEVKRWKIVAIRKGWHYTVKPLRDTEI